MHQGCESPCIEKITRKRRHEENWGVDGRKERQSMDFNFFRLPFISRKYFYQLKVKTD